jgi:hypothetical protein
MVSPSSEQVHVIRPRGVTVNKNEKSCQSSNFTFKINIQACASCKMERIIPKILHITQKFYIKMENIITESTTYNLKILCINGFHKLPK